MWSRPCKHHRPTGEADVRPLIFNLDTRWFWVVRRDWRGPTAGLDILEKTRTSWPYRECNTESSSHMQECDKTLNLFSCLLHSFVCRSYCLSTPLHAPSFSHPFFRLFFLCYTSTYYIHPTLVSQNACRFMTICVKGQLRLYQSVNVIKQ
jgi:hypothetical protein